MSTRVVAKSVVAEQVRDVGGELVKDKRGHSRLKKVQSHKIGNVPKS